MSIEYVLYRLVEVRDGHLVLQAPNGAVRVVGAKGLQPGQATPRGVRFGTPLCQYTVPREDYVQIVPLLAAEAAERRVSARIR